MKKIGENREKQENNGFNCAKTWDTKEKHEQHKPIQMLRACLAMCLKFEKFEALCAYKPRAYIKKSVLEYSGLMTDVI